MKKGVVDLLLKAFSFFFFFVKDLIYSYLESLLKKNSVFEDVLIEINYHA